MKKNITINLCGRLFQIDEDACNMLQHYIDSLRSSFGKQEGGDEIVDDIEARIAELFDELKAKGHEAITIDHVKDVITRIGSPEELSGEEEQTARQASSEQDGKAAASSSFESAANNLYNNVRERTAGKKLFRNPKDKMLAGVLSGLATYTGTDPIIWRLLTVLLFCFYGVGLLAYIILAIVLPEARTPEQLLQMEGKQVTPQNLADVVVDTDKAAAERPSLLRSLFSLLLKVLFGFFVGIAVFVGAILCIGFLFALVVLVSALAFPVSSHLPFSLESMGLAELYQSNPLVLILFALSLFMLLLIPIYAIVHLVLSLAGKASPMGTAQRIVWILLWIVALCCVVPCGITMAQYSRDHDSRKYHERYNVNYLGVEMSRDDADYLQEGEWKVVKAENCDHYTWSGLYFTGDRSIRFLDSYNYECRHVYQMEHQAKVEPGIYTLEANGRADGRGCYIYVLGDEKLLAEIPPYGKKGGELIEHFRRSKPELDSLVAISQEPKWKQQLSDKILRANHGKGYGWSTIRIDSIVVSQTDTLAYGVTNDAAFTGQPCRSQWFSATDFTLTRTGDLPKKKSQKKH